MNLKQALESSLSLWDILRNKNVAKSVAVAHLPPADFDLVANAPFHCPVCDYMEVSNENKPSRESCAGCPVDWTQFGGRCTDVGSPFREWALCSQKEERKEVRLKLAGQVFSLISEAYDTEFPAIEADAPAKQSEAA